jgi:predicted GIY-YIG superfamily endonuclease
MVKLEETRAVKKTSRRKKSALVSETAVKQEPLTVTVTSDGE